MKSMTPIHRRIRTATFLLIALCINSLSEASQNVYDAAICSTTFICAPQGDVVSMGSGVLIDAQRRLVVTNEHVIAGGERVIVFFPEIQQGQINCDQAYYLRHVQKIGIEAKVLMLDKQRDIAVLQLSRLPAHARAITIGASARPGQMVHSIGNPDASDAMWIYTNGYVRANYYKTFHDARMQVVETSSPTNQGDSGGPILNDEGQLVGLTQSFQTQGRLVSNGVDISEVTWLVGKVISQMEGGNLPVSPAPSGSGGQVAAASGQVPSSTLMRLANGFTRR